MAQIIKGDLYSEELSWWTMFSTVKLLGALRPDNDSCLPGISSVCVPYRHVINGEKQQTASIVEVEVTSSLTLCEHKEEVEGVDIVVLKPR
jgi:hypothetical protein